MIPLGDRVPAPPPSSEKKAASAGDGYVVFRLQDLRKVVLRDEDNTPAVITSMPDHVIGALYVYDDFDTAMRAARGAQVLKITVVTET